MESEEGKGGAASLWDQRGRGMRSYMDLELRSTLVTVSS